jgi:hypothetical protein
MFDDAELIHSYSRSDAIRDGVLIDVTPTACQAGFRWPVAITRAVGETCVRVPDGVVGQDEAGRLWDVLFVLRCAIARQGGRVIAFAVHVRNDNSEGTPPLVRLKAVSGPGDQGEPVLTIMLPDED